mmetsp:Transcript_28067/g.50273  ORF Transcript_28067/g.50273 Transcript_28067/m.50273 type:complete len:267 (-) Transcript_28067:778-1578(-)
MEITPAGLTRLHWVKLSVSVCLLLFSILLCLQLYGALSAPYLAISIPLYWVLFSVPVSLHIALNSITHKLRSLSMTVLLFSAYSLATSTAVFIFMAALHLDSIIDANWAVIFIPLWFALFIYLVLCAFLYPGLVNERIKMRRNACLLFLYFATALAFTVALVVKLDTDNPDIWACVFSPLWAGLFTHALTFYIFDVSEGSRGLFTTEKALIAYAMVQSILWDLHLDVSAVPVWAVFLPFAWIVVAQKQYMSRPAESERLLRAANVA